MSRPQLLKKSLAVIGLMVAIVIGYNASYSLGFFAGSH